MLDRHGGTAETSASLYLIPGLVDLDVAYAAEVTLRTHRPLSSSLAWTA